MEKELVLKDTVQVNRAGQIVIPVKFRELVGIKQGDTLSIALVRGGGKWAIFMSEVE